MQIFAPLRLCVSLKASSVIGDNMKQERILWVIAVSVWLIAQPLFAQVGLNLGSEYGMGMIARIGNGPVALEAGAGVSILFVGWQVERFDGFGSSMVSLC